MLPITFKSSDSTDAAGLDRERLKNWLFSLDVSDTRTCRSIATFFWSVSLVLETFCLH